MENDDGMALDASQQQGGRTQLVHTVSEAQTRALAHVVAAHLTPGSIVWLDGPLGSGKTTLVRYLAEAFGIDGSSVSSPTYTLCHNYTSPTGVTLAHLDAYRFGEDDDLLQLGGEELWGRDDVIWIVEWPERIEHLMPVATVVIDIEHLGPTKRGFAIRGIDAEIRSVFGSCPICGQPTMHGAENAPFCSSQCRLVDLNKWFSGAHRISREMTADDLDGQV